MPCLVSFHPVVLQKKSFVCISHRVLCKTKFPSGIHLGWLMANCNNTFSAPHKEHACHVWFYSFQLYLYVFHFNEVPRWQPAWVMDRLQSSHIWTATHKEHSCHVWFHSIQWFYKRKHLYALSIGPMLNEVPR